MFIRRTQTRSTSSGEAYFTHRLVRSERIGDKVRQRTLLNLGRHFDVAQSDWPTLCRRIDEVLGGQLQLAPDCPPALEAHAQHIAAQLLARHHDLSGAAVPSQRRDVQPLDVDSLELVRPRSVGVEHVALWAMDQLGLRTWLQELGIGASLRAAAIGSIIARMARPGSERAARRWLGERSALGELLGVDFWSDAALSRLRRADGPPRGRQHHRSTGRWTCSTYRHGLRPDQYLLRRRGGRTTQGTTCHSKDKRTDCPLLTLGMVLDASGFVRRSQVFAGNVNITRWPLPLEAPRAALVVMDRGIATEDRVVAREQGYRLRGQQSSVPGTDSEADWARIESRRASVLSDDAQEVVLLLRGQGTRHRRALSPNASRTRSPNSPKDCPNRAPRNDSTRSGSASVAQGEKPPSPSTTTFGRATRRALPGSMMTHGTACAAITIRSHAVAHLLHAD